METAVRLLDEKDAPLLEKVAHGVFDKPVNPEWSRQFLADPRHHLAVALAEGVVVGMATAVDYIHPDKPLELWINEVGVAPEFRGRGLAGRLMAVLFEVGRDRGCASAWVLTEPDNQPARNLYAKLGGAEEAGLLFEFRL